MLVPTNKDPKREDELKRQKKERDEADKNKRGRKADHPR